MHLLERNSAGKFSLTAFVGDNIPPYAILSHTWGSDTEEPTFQDLMHGTGLSKPGFSKIQFCGEQAGRDGLQYFWVDTCCIDKSSSSELQEAINSMFHWYQNAAKCYVFLSDVSTRKRKARDQCSEHTWGTAFRSSKWFTRGWTLQELLAPGPDSVSFFSYERDLIGDKRSLEQEISEITRIPITALRGTPLSQFEVNDRLLWAKDRQTKRKEDEAYSLFGIFDIQLPLLYGEGRDKAFKRLQEEIDKPLKVILDKLPSVDNATFDSHDEEHNARCYPGTRGVLLQQVDTWAGDEGSECIFWLNGMAGTGKSTISRTVAQNFADKGDLGASFFFKRGEGDRGHARFFITTIATQLARKVPSLTLHVKNAIEADPAISQKALRQQFETLFLQPLRKIRNSFQESLRIVIIIDALDECDREEDISIIISLLPQVQHISSVRLKFFLTSRPELPIRLGFEDISGKYKGLVLHEIPMPIIQNDILVFLEHELAMIRNSYNKSVKTVRRQLPFDWPSRANVQILAEMAIPLFIFATTICRFINDRRCGQPNEQLAKVLKYQTKSQASKLDTTYLPVLNQLLVGVTQSEKRSIMEEFQQVVGAIIILASPLSAPSLDRLLSIPEGTVDSRTDLLHSVLSIPSDPDHPIRLLHLSFRDFLLDPEKREINPFWVEEKQAHHRIFYCCIQLMSSFLKKDICGLEDPGISVEEVASSRVDRCLPLEVRYACLYWIQHLQSSGAELRDNEQVHQFLKVHLLHWLEALGWIGKISEAILAIISLEEQISADQSPMLYTMIHDIKRFALYSREVIEQAPLQLYSSALLFAPKNSIIRRQFEGYIPTWIHPKPKVQADWDATLQILAGHMNYGMSVAFSPDGKQIASGSDNGTVRLWDATIGAELQTLVGHSRLVLSVAFSPDGKQLVSGSHDSTVRLWNTTTGVELRTFAGHSRRVMSVAFSPDGKQIASGSYDNTIRLWDITTGAVLQTLVGHSSPVMSAAFSPDGKQVVSGSDDGTIRLWDATAGAGLQMLPGDSTRIMSVAFSPDGKQIVSGSDDGTVRLWDATTGAELQTLVGHSRAVMSVAYSPDGKQIISGSDDNTVRLWDATTGAEIQTFAGHSRVVMSVAFSPDGKRIVSGSDDGTIRLWDATAAAGLQTLPGDSSRGVMCIAFSSDGKHIASGSCDNTVRLWDATTGAELQTLVGHWDWVMSVAFSPDGRQVVSGSNNGTIRLWDATTGAGLQTLVGHSNWVMSVAFSPNGKQVVSGSSDNTVRLWNTTTGVELRTFAGHSDWVDLVAFSSDGKQIISGSHDSTVRHWDATTGAELQTLVGHSSPAFSPDGKQLPTLLVTMDWVIKKGRKVLWLPPNDRVTSCIAIRDKTIVLGYASGRVSIVGFQEEIEG
ncbi:hypothetical protein BP6252_01558 [Coleophoma cylindrospora]|uniref:Mitochondrial division protein 1 n=1 Tax=Coleophoma cylindrospora TaxID=1849047 RepID=A0A3D8ST98_9HELO|nr:hypothetical protein BP6252_01558 [Coleophoma cylindrospora]